MAVKTLGTNANNSITNAVNFQKSLADADVATIAQAVKDDVNVTHPIWPGAFARNGLLYVPNRGVLRIFIGDWVGVDSRGWPILLSADTIANGNWTHS